MGNKKMSIAEKAMFVRLNKHDFYRLDVQGVVKNPIATKLAKYLESEYDFVRQTVYFTLYPFLQLYKEMYPEGPYGEECTPPTKEDKTHSNWKDARHGHKRIPDTITSCKQVPFI